MTNTSLAEKDYGAFFETIRNYTDYKKRQIANGMNDYNMVNIVRKENAEVGMHSNVIYSLIDPNGLHYRGDLFLNLFIRDVMDLKDFGKILSVQAEEATSDNRRIDFTIKSTNYFVGIEMKIDASDSTNQISSYVKDLKNKAKEDRDQQVKMYYLTKDGKEASKESHQGVEYKTISFKEHILNWIINCQKEVRHITNLNLALENYKHVVQKITGQYKGNLMSLEEFLKEQKNEDIGELYAILDEIDSMQKNVTKNFLTTLMDSLEVDIEKKIGTNFIDLFAGEYTIRLYFSGSELIIQLGERVQSFKNLILEEKRRKFISLLQDIKFTNLNWPKGYGEINLGKVKLQTQNKLINDVNLILFQILNKIK